MGIGETIDPNTDIATLDAAVDACFATPLSCMSVESVSDRLAALAAVTAKLDALRVAVVAHADVIVVSQLSDQRNTANHVAYNTNGDPAVTRYDLRLGNWLKDFPELAAAFQRGQIQVEHVEKLRLADNPRCHQQLIADQHQFIASFTSCWFRDIDQIIEHWLLGADPDGTAPRDQQPRTGITIQMQPGGLTKISGLLDPLQGAAIRDAIYAENAALRREEKDAGITSTVRQRTLRALLNLIGRGAARPDGSHARPRVNIVLSQRVYEKTLKWLEDPATNQFPDLDRNDIDKRCHLIDGTPIHPLYALAATVTATFRRLVYSARGRPIDVSVDTRRIPDWMRDVTLITTNGKCSNPVCDAPFQWLHADHITPYSHTQTTTLHDTRPLCEADNLWRGNDTTRGVWTADLDMDSNDDDLEFDLDLDEQTEEEIAHQIQFIRARLANAIAAEAA